LCGIAGFTHTKSSPDPERIQRAVASLIHRGPDQQGSFETSTASLGATRLKIIDLGGGDQPIVSGDGDTVIAYNGEIYNHLEIRSELEQRGHRFRSRSDTETVLEAFLEWDLDCFQRLRGMFAIALWSESRKRLVLARDRMGIKPLYIARHAGELYFGSELKAILVHPEIERRLSHNGLDCYLSLNYVPCPWTLIEGIEKLPPGSWLEWREGQIRAEAYWRLPFGERRGGDLETAKRELDGLLEQAVREHLLSDVPLGVWLSGGIDSSTLLYYASRASSSRLKTFSISFRGRSFDETKYIREMAARYDTEHEELDLNTDLALDGVIEEFAYYADEPDADSSAVPVWFLSKLTKRTATVALSGEGGDELFAGYVTYRANDLARIARRAPRASLAAAFQLLSRWPVSDEKISFEYKAKRFLEGCRMPAERAHVFWNGTFSEPEKHSLVSRDLPHALDEIIAHLSAKGDRPGAYLWFDQRYYLPDDILMKVDRMSMAHAVEVRPVLLDHRIVEFAASLPPQLKMRGSHHKVVLKELMKDKLPPSILRHKKTGLDIPAHEWLRGPLRPLLLDTFTAAAREHAELFRFDAIEDFVRRHMARRANLGYHLWGLMILFLWMRRWRVQTGPLSERGSSREKIFTPI